MKSDKCILHYCFLFLSGISFYRLYKCEEMIVYSDLIVINEK